MQLIKRTIEMAEMTNPDIQSYERPMLLQDVLDLDEANLNEQYFNLGLYIYNEDNNNYVDIPDQIGRFKAKIEINESGVG